MDVVVGLNLTHHLSVIQQQENIQPILALVFEGLCFTSCCLNTCWLRLETNKGHFFTAFQNAMKNASSQDQIIKLIYEEKVVGTLEKLCVCPAHRCVNRNLSHSMSRLSLYSHQKGELKHFWKSSGFLDSPVEVNTAYQNQVTTF